MSIARLEPRLDDLNDEIQLVSDHLRAGGDPIIAQRLLQAAKAGLMALDRDAWIAGQQTSAPSDQRDLASLRDDIAAAVAEVDRLLDQAHRIATTPSTAPVPAQALAPARRRPVPGFRMWFAGLLVIALGIVVLVAGQTMLAAWLFVAGGVTFIAGLVRSLAWSISGS